MTFFKTIYKFFFQPKKGGFENHDLDKKSEEPKFCKVEFKSDELEINNLKPDTPAEKIDIPVKQEIDKKEFKKKKRKSKSKPSPISENKKTIRKIDSSEDLYELFTGEKDSGVVESDLPINHKISPDKRSVSEIIASYPSPEKIVDLHGMSLREAEVKMDNEMLTAKMNNFRTILFITGKGRHSEDGQSVLKIMAEKKAIIFKKSGDILTFRWEKKQKRKSGAILFYL
jgi:DNA-nicking Smr family endonuclease